MNNMLTGKMLAGKVALVTGGSRGIGRSICVALAAEGAHVYVNYSSRSDAAEETAELCKKAGAAAEVLGFNVAESAKVDEAFEQIRAKSGKLDILVNNAGIAKDALLMRLKDEVWNEVLTVNLTGSLNCARAAAKVMMKARYGRIINISSVVGEMGNAGQAAYSASKAGLIGLTKTMAKELASRSITVNAVAPGFIVTDMTSGLSDELKTEHLKAIPLGRYGNPEEIASLVTFLASDHSAYITGQVIGVNGGMYV